MHSCTDCLIACTPQVQGCRVTALKQGEGGGALICARFNFWWKVCCGGEIRYFVGLFFCVSTGRFLKTARLWERLLVDMKGAIGATFAEKQRLTNERRWQGGGEVLAERNTFVSLWSSERPVRHREMTSSRPQGALPVLANWQIDQRGQVWFRIASEIKLFWAFVISGIMKFVIKAGYIALVCIRSKTRAAE